MPRTIPAAVTTKMPAYRVLYNFAGTPDGARPEAVLLYVTGTFYGATFYGGTYGKGTVFSLTKDGAEKVLHSFAGGNDGAEPASSLIDVDGTLYGTTYYGGPYNRGTVFSMQTTGAERVLHSFGNGSDGQTPNAGLIDVHGTLYGTTEVGGGPNWGTVFAIGPMRGSIGEHIVYAFTGFSGGIPTSSLLYVKGAFYGTTRFGGSYGRPSGGDGVVFRVTAKGAETVLHDFGNGTDGSQPNASLIDVKGTLYGTTQTGGRYASGDAGGVVFSITTHGEEHVLHDFGAGSDGAYPWAGLLDLGGTLYGTTYEGGAYNDGIVFAMSTAGIERVLHGFSGRPDGSEPSANLIAVDGTLYGTTFLGGNGGSSKLGAGAVFSLRP